MPIDAGVFNNIKTFADYQRADQDFQLRKQLADAQLLTSQAQLAKAGEIDVDKLGEQAFYKAAQGIPLTPGEAAAARLVDAKSGGIQFNPVTGEMTQKPRLSDKINIPGLGTPTSASQGSAPSPSHPAQSDVNTFSSPNPTPQDDFDANYRQELAAASGNPKLQQALKEKYAGAKILMNEEQTKAAGFSDRMLQSNPIINQTKAAATDAGQAMRSSIPLVGNFLVSDDKQTATQAQEDFVNAILRRESGAAISKSEFDNAARQYFPRPGDSDAVIAQKEANREAAINAVRRSAGPAYKPSGVTAIAPQSAPAQNPPAQINPSDAINELRRRGKL